MTHTHGFELLREEAIEELNAVGRFYRHIKTGAEVLTIQNDDENKVFGITFRTPPPDSSGVAHIMEHSVLCGSRKYAVREPFVELMKGSLNTFLNAMTYPDKTTYPVASANLQDFYNLVDVYLDAVLFPNLTPSTLMQEGWHYEVEEDGTLSYKGVVFNEMKGAYSSPDGVLDEVSQHAVFPEAIYGFDSGGDPTAIPGLTWEQFEGFHRRFYHPSNARIFFYGDDPEERRLEKLAEFLNEFDWQAVDSQIAPQTRFAQPRRLVQGYEAAEDENKRMLTVNWMLPEALKTPQGMVDLAVLERALTGTPADPLYRALIESGLGEDLTGRGLDMGLRQPFYSVGLKGVSAENVDAVETLILDTLRRLAEEGFDADTVGAALNSVEFALRENNTGSYPRGLAVMLRAMDLWLYGEDPFGALRLEAPLAALKARLAQGERVLEGLTRELFVDNPHRVTVILEPDAHLADRRAQDERARLDRAAAGMDADALAAVAAAAEELQRRQETPDSPEALAAIPTLKLSDLEPLAKKIPGELSAVGEGQLLYHDLFTNGILYFDVGFDLHQLPQEWLPFVPLFGRALTEMGTQRESYVQLLQRIGRSTGGVHTQVLLSARPGGGPAAAWLFLRGKVMAERSAELLDILRDVLTEVNFDNRERFRQMVLEARASLEGRLADVGHRVVNSRLRARFDEAGWVSETIGGVSWLFFLRELTERLERDWTGVLAVLEGMRERLLHGRGMMSNVTLEAARWGGLRPAVEDFLNGLPLRELRAESWQPPVYPANEGLAIPAQVNYVGAAANLFAHGYTWQGSTLAVLQYLNATWMWEKVRVQGGAYGGFASFDPYSGVFSLLSYRDPNLKATLDIYRRTPEFLKNLALDEAERVKAIIGAAGDLDAYQLPDAKGYTGLVRHLLGVSDELRQRIRDGLLNSSPQDFQAFGALLEQALADTPVVVMGAGDALEEAGLPVLRVL
ncbi:insulinase family protein [Levilinea saccharolytica]|uniref:Peptidase M16 n=1 Tax=Levilinea saccharolytica TaxID=229921 RepID=A0A0P6XW28_9CHLR|nr:insulinase family protein [Levilinea saccharolytica]KPL79589.1 peptidase M16 [Levilinea saccharolytica]GAP17395.1 pre-sequence protease. Metallo peptidase. MEROPS family M16C [Levilinea saccharolytica]